MVLHPTESRYGQAHPGFDAFSKEPLEENGYVTTNSVRDLILHPLYSSVALEAMRDTTINSANDLWTTDI